jgi:hypothetical protein
LEWRKLVELDNISNEFSKIFGDGKEPSWAIIFQGSDAAEVQAPTDAAGSAIVEVSKGFDEPASSEARRHLNVEDVSRLLGTELMIETTLAQRHLRQSMNSFHYFCGFNNVNGYIPYLMEMMPRMRDATLPLLSKIPIPYKMEIVSPHLITGVARTFELEIAAFDIDRKDQVTPAAEIHLRCYCLKQIVIKCCTIFLTSAPLFAAPLLHRLPSDVSACGGRCCGSSGCFGHRTCFLWASFLKKAIILRICGKHTGLRGPRARAAKAAKQRNLGTTTRYGFII